MAQEVNPRENLNVLVQDMAHSNVFVKLVVVES